MLEFIDNYLNQITMYRLTLYVLTFLWLCAFIFSLFGLMPFGFFELLLSTLFLIAVCWYTNKFFAWLFRVPANIDSAYITAFILSLIIMHNTSKGGLAFIFVAGLVAMASKYL